MGAESDADGEASDDGKSDADGETSDDGKIISGNAQLLDQFRSSGLSNVHGDPAEFVGARLKIRITFCAHRPSLYHHFFVRLFGFSVRIAPQRGAPS